MGNWLGKLFYGDAEPESNLKKSKNSIIQEIIQTGGPTGLTRHLNIRRKCCKDEPINLGIAGRPNTGKSSLINAILNVKDNINGFDQVESCERLTAPRKYCHPIEKQLLFFELPGIGSENWTKCEYVLKTQLWKYDYFFIVFDTVLHEDDLWLAQQLMKMKKPFVLVRSKVDLDIKLNCNEDAGSNIKKLRKKTYSSIDKYDVLKANVGVCFISSVNEDIGEMEKLKNHIISNLKSKTFETELYSLNALSKEIISKKYISLKKRILVVTTAVALVSATRFFWVDIAILACELYYYVTKLGLCRKEMESLINVEDRLENGRKLEKINWGLIRYILNQSPKLVALTAVAVNQKKFEIFSPIFGAVGTSVLSGLISYYFLSTILDNFTHDSVIMYDKVVSKHVPRNTPISVVLQFPSE